MKLTDDKTISTISIPVPKLEPEQLDQVDGWLRSVMWDNKLPAASEPSNWDIHRSKGRLVFKNGAVKMLQGVRELFDLTDAPNHENIEELEGKIILIGRQLNAVDFERSFKKAIT